MYINIIQLLCNYSLSEASFMVLIIKLQCSYIYSLQLYAHYISILMPHTAGFLCDLFSKAYITFFFFFFFCKTCITKVFTERYNYTMNVITLSSFLKPSLEILFLYTLTLSPPPTSLILAIQGTMSRLLLWASQKGRRFGRGRGCMFTCSCLPTMHCQGLRLELANKLLPQLL